MLGVEGAGEHFFGYVAASFSAGECCLKDWVGFREVVSIEGRKSSAFVSAFSSSYVEEV